MFVFQFCTAFESAGNYILQVSASNGVSEISRDFPVVVMRRISMVTLAIRPVVLGAESDIEIRVRHFLVPV